jgi:carbonic anhydrase
MPDKAPDKATPKPAAKTTAAAPAAPLPARKAPDEGLDKVAVRLVEAMARASAKQDKRETVRSPPKKAADTSNRAAAAHGSTAAHADAHWSYAGDTGPANWAKLKPEFNVCAIGQRQSPIPIDDSATLQGPAEPIGFNYRPSEGSVVNNGHTIQVDVAPGNSIAVRSGNFDLLQFHFHHPSEEQVNGQRFPMVAHLVHKSTEGQLAVVAVLLTKGEANPAIDTVWKYLPLDSGDRVKLPPGVLNLPDLLPKDQRYYQFMGSLTTPPCTEGVLWMVLKTPVTLSPAQIRLFGQLFPNNARPVQELNGRPVREEL